MTERKIGMLGAGNMAGALITGMLGAEILQPGNLGVADVRTDRVEALKSEFGVVSFPTNAALIDWADVVVLGVKPQVIDRVLNECGDAFRAEHLVVSIAAGVPIAAFESRLPDGTSVVRVMPNTAAIAQASASAIAPGEHATDEDVALVKRLFDAVGRTVVLDESLIDAVTGLSGSGPAYIMLIIEALADGGVKVGLHRETALLLAAQTVFGSAKLLLDTGEHPGRLKDMVTSPGGTAIAGLHTLESGGLRRTLIDAVDTATNRASELGAEIAAKLEASRGGRD